MVQFAKRAIQSTFPAIYKGIQMRFGLPAHYTRAGDAVIKRHGRCVQSGPFKGLKYIEGSAGSAYTPKLLGCYELEIQGWVEEACQKPYTHFLDVGCAEGYYAVGFAVRRPNAAVLAFDTDKNATTLCTQLAELNGVSDRVTVGGFCSASDISALPAASTLLFCDIESCELELLDPVEIPSLLVMDMIVELHEPMRPGLTRTLLERFAATHDIEVVDAVPRDTSTMECVAFLPEKDRFFAVDETRPPGQQFAFFRSRRAG